MHIRQAQSDLSKIDRLPYIYLRRVFEELPAAIAAEDEAAITKLLPWNVADADA